MWPWKSWVQIPSLTPLFSFLAGLEPLTRAMGCSQAVKARGFDSRMRRFESCRPSQCDPVAQLAEHLTFNQRVRSSSLRWVTTFNSRGRGGMADAPDLGSGVPGTYEFESLRPHQTNGREGRDGQFLKAEWIRGCNSMAERQPSKLDTWVRFPSPAPIFFWKVLAKETVLWYTLFR